MTTIITCSFFLSIGVYVVALTWNQGLLSRPIGLIIAAMCSGYAYQFGGIPSSVWQYVAITWIVGGAALLANFYYSGTRYLAPKTAYLLSALWPLAAIVSGAIWLWERRK